jgi:hypothetical protein
MPRKRRIPKHRLDETVDPHLFAFGDGTWSYFQGDPVYPDVDAARAAWQECRREVWALSHRGRVPGAATTYDGLSFSSIDALRSEMSNSAIPFSLPRILDALDDDRARLAAFREAHPVDAKAIGDYLDTLEADFDAVETTARAVDPRSRWQAAIPLTIPLALTYAA